MTENKEPEEIAIEALNEPRLPVKFVDNSEALNDLVEVLTKVT